MSIKNPLHNVMVVDHSFEHGKYLGWEDGVKATNEDWIEWGESECPHAYGEGIKKRCEYCWQERKKELNNEYLTEL